ncbi:Hypothetical_protein [Hexamita inflata]|uniref:Hypothetical_protein n=1 Tax=Hexamita inflata TaxID=28002 RepID=A0ABP1L0G4_9EUKA
MQDSADQNIQPSNETPRILAGTNVDLEGFDSGAISVDVAASLADVYHQLRLLGVCEDIWIGSGVGFAVARRKIQVNAIYPNYHPTSNIVLLPVTARHCGRDVSSKQVIIGKKCYKVTVSRKVSNFNY